MMSPVFKDNCEGCLDIGRERTQSGRPRGDRGRNGKLSSFQMAHQAPPTLKSWCIFLKRKETQESWKMGLGSGVGPHQAEVSRAVLSVYTLPDVFKSAFGSLGTVRAGHAQGL